MLGAINTSVNEKDEESVVVVAVVDETLSRLRLALGLSMCKGQVVGSSLRAGRLNTMMSAQ